MKYIRFKSVGLVMFEEYIDHDEMAKKIGDTVISAGHMTVVQDDVVRVYGDSLTLNKSPAEGDESVIQKTLEKMY